MKKKFAIVLVSNIVLFAVSMILKQYISTAVTFTMFEMIFPDLDGEMHILIYQVLDYFNIFILIQIVQAVINMSFITYLYKKITKIKPS